MCKHCKHPSAIRLSHHDTTTFYILHCSVAISTAQFQSYTDALASPRLAMPPRLPLGPRRICKPVAVRQSRITAQRRFASSSATVPEIYDVVCVGGGPAGLSLLTGLRSSNVTAGLKVALIDGQDLYKNRLAKDASLDNFSNRCSSLTPASVKNLQGEFTISTRSET